MQTSRKEASTRAQYASEQLHQLDSLPRCGSLHEDVVPSDGVNHYACRACAEISDPTTDRTLGVARVGHQSNASLLVPHPPPRRATWTENRQVSFRPPPWYVSNLQITPRVTRGKQDHAFAGIGAGIVAVLCMHPLDLLKVKFQVANHSPKGGIGRQIWTSLKEIKDTQGWKGLYRGVGPNIAGNASSWGLYFLLCAPTTAPLRCLRSLMHNVYPATTC